jgi:acetolactate synthase I/II/III large subunit
VKVTVGEALIHLLEQVGVDTVFGIPGVHTIELYRGLAASKIRHVTPRHEQSAAFMADGYARVSGKPGVCLLITGPGLTNALTAMAQARADSIPMLVISGVNARQTLGKGFGHLHELPNQSGMVKTVALWSHTLLNPVDLGSVLAEAFHQMTAGRPGPVHIEIPTDVMKMRLELPEFALPVHMPLAPDESKVAKAAELLNNARSPVILCGGGAVDAADQVHKLAQTLDAPVVQTVNARGIIGHHPLSVPASPSLNTVRNLLTSSDLVLALGTEFGPTDYDMYDSGAFPALANLIRVDVNAAQLARKPETALAVQADAGVFLTEIMPHIAILKRDGVERAAVCRTAAFAELSPAYQSHIELCRAIYQELPDAIIVGDSTQPVYAGNLYLEVPQPSSWFNAATGFGALGYGPPSAIGASLAAPNRPIICLVGDGGLQFSLAEIGTAKDENANVIFIVWNNHGYLEIENAMIASGVESVGVKPSAPDFVKIAKAYRMHGDHLKVAELRLALAKTKGPYLFQIDT